MKNNEKITKFALLDLSVNSVVDTVWCIQLDRGHLSIYLTDKQSQEFFLLRVLTLITNTCGVSLAVMIKPYEIC